MRHAKKSQYKEIEKRVIYIILSPLSKEFFIGHCRKDLLKSVFRQHFYGERYQTKKCFSEFKKQNLHPCLFVLEEVVCTKVKAFNYVVAWTKICCEQGFENLNRGNVQAYISNPLEETENLYRERRKENIAQKVICSNCIVSNYRNKMCSMYGGRNSEV